MICIIFLLHSPTHSYISMFPFKEEEFPYNDALDLKYAETEAVAAQHHAKQSK